VPRLEEAAAWAAESGAWLNVEIKSPGVEAAAVAAVEGAGVLSRTFFSSFLPDVVARAMEAAPHAAHFLLAERWDDESRAHARRLGVRGVCLHHSAATRAALRSFAPPPWTRWSGRWTTPARLRELLRAGVRAVITNHPARAMEALRRSVPPGEAALSISSPLTSGAKSRRLKSRVRSPTLRCKLIFHNPFRGARLAPSGAAAARSARGAHTP
jgi:hypothetical protein